MACSPVGPWNSTGAGRAQRFWASAIAQLHWRSFLLLQKGMVQMKPIFDPQLDTTFCFPGKGTASGSLCKGVLALNC